MVAQYEVTIVGGVPTALSAVLQIPPEDNNISNIRTGLTGAALLPPTVGERFEQITNCPLHEILGMTETSGLVSIDPTSGPGSKGSVGWALPYTKVEILRLNDDGNLGDRCDVEEIGVNTI